jgi:predicted O-methyltransferase YrrM
MEAHMKRFIVLWLGLLSTATLTGYSPLTAHTATTTKEKAATTTETTTTPEKKTLIDTNSAPADELKSLSALPPDFMNAIASLHRGDPQKGTDGGMHKIDSVTGISMDDGLQIYNLVRKVKPKKTLEVGFAYGVSTMYFLAALQANGFGSHIAIDPYEIDDWNGIGLMKVKEVKMEDSFEFIPERSHPALAKLADKKLTFDVMFIDGAHLYDIAFADFVLADPLCPKGGYILFHDTWMGSVQRIISFIEKNRLDFTRQPSSAANIAIFQKTDDDKRPWDHFKEF